VKEINIDKDDKRELFTLMLKFKDGGVFPARSLSDGTLRFVGLSVIELDSKSSGVICLEEPENGIHPQKIDSMIRLLTEIATDTQYPVDHENALRQVIINTHSPIVVQLVPDDSLLVAESKEAYSTEFGMKYTSTTFSPLNETWRTKIDGESVSPVSLGNLLAYLNPVTNITEKEFDEIVVNEPEPAYKSIKLKQPQRVIDRMDIRQLRLDL
jgi:AAA15 family ATPase/GTPase